MNMEVDGGDTLSSSCDGGKFSNLKAFVTAAREFEATHSDSAVNLMTRYLGVSNLIHPPLVFIGLNLSYSLSKKSRK